MEHLSQAELNDYARGLRRDPNQHLASCDECGKQLAFLRKVAESSRRIEVPREVVEDAKRIFPTPEPRERGLKEVLARLVFLQNGQEVLANVRSVQQAARQAVYRYGDYSIDLRAESELDSIRTSLTGQIAHDQERAGALNDIEIALISGPQTLQTRKCNALGEFLMDFVGHPRLRLRFDLPEDGIAIVVPLKDLGSEN